METAIKSSPAKTSSLMYGTFRGDLALSAGDISIETGRQDGLVIYRRVCRDQAVEKILATGPEALLVHPVPPLYLPKAVSHHLEILFPPVTVGPFGEVVVYLIFPIEIGVFVRTRDQFSVLDIFCLEKPKYTLYGTASGGKIARWCESRVMGGPPDVDPLAHGVVQLSIRNFSRGFLEVKRVVFEDVTMYLYFNRERVFMEGIMEVFSDLVAETRSVRTSQTGDMENALPPFAVKNLLFVEKGPFMMEFGV